ncbi:PREDICTED: uncharacterized protein LOC106785842 isoform X2 [Polistes canadensis]|uniref:uncharacterized protein LOC106785842 isoform X2 n=1 Tax=Polistes canadensis TaxID=91411 RepID=UPI000718FAA6|nr:PREDICTED: uncharacterized protein LOC106785842 isoform X2 [Polistes canadensis]
MEDQLEQIKQDVFQQVSLLKKKIYEEETVKFRQLTSSTRKPSSTEEDFSDKEYSWHEMRKICKISQRITGIKFKNSTKNWIKDKIYKYTTSVDSKTINFYLELTVDLKVLIYNKFIKKITSWVQSFSKLKNLSFLMSGISDYSYCNRFRQKVITSLKENNYANIYEREYEGGGILLDIKSPKNPNHIYLKYLWTLNYVERTCRIDHHFIITATDFGVEFVEENTPLIKKFCKLNLKKQDLVELWAELCTAIEIYEDQNM